MKTKSIMNKALLTGLLMNSISAFAYPTLQLDIDGGTYDPVTQTIIKSGSSFDVYAYGIQPNGNNAPDITGIQYYISAALTGSSGLVPQLGQSLGSFTYDLGSGAVTVNVTSGMVFGTPPLDTFLQAFDNGDLSKHGIFPTYFTQIDLPKFDTAFQTAPYDTSGISAGHSIALSGTGMFYQKVNFNLTNLTAGYDLHWDLYSAAVVTCGNNPNCNPTDIDVNDFAPFSHDAESTKDNNPPPPPPPDPIPEPATVWLLGLGLLVLASYKRRQVKLSA